MELAQVPVILNQVTQEVNRIVFGVEKHTKLALAALMVRGHVLLEGPPGVAKTLFARVLAHCLGMDNRRLQCTPDLMPGDVLGANIFNFEKQSFTLVKGPVFSEFLLVDEINRTPPKTQASLLEAMQERAVTIDGVTHKLSPNFMVFATQNPIEHEGTYPLPEAQLDRFLFRLDFSYPEPEQELSAVLAHCNDAGMPTTETMNIQRLFNAEILNHLQALPAMVRIEPDVARYAVNLGRATREHHALAVGISPRATTMLVAAARAMAACDGRDYTIPDDVKQLFHSVVAHRVILSASAEMDGLSIKDVLNELLQRVPAPR